MVAGIRREPPSAATTCWPPLGGVSSSQLEMCAKVGPPFTLTNVRSAASTGTGWAHRARRKRASSARR